MPGKGGCGVSDRLEVRTAPIEGLEARAGDDGKEMRISGYAAVFERLSEPLGGYREKIQKGAFAESLRKHPVKAFWNHNADMVLGSTKNGTLDVEEDGKGLRFALRLPDTSWGRDAYESVRRGDVDGVSFGFRAEGDAWDGSNPKQPVRTLTSVRLFEISPTPIPAYPATGVAARSMKEAYAAYRDAAAGEQSKRAMALKKLELIEKESC
jgi:HK97 family phage prohead protease